MALRIFRAVFLCASGALLLVWIFGYTIAIEVL